MNQKKIQIECVDETVTAISLHISNMCELGIIPHCLKRATMHHVGVVF